MAVAADGDPDLWPVMPEATDQPAQVTADLGARGRLAGAQQHGDRPARRRVIDVDREEAALVVIGVEQRELLMAMNDTIAVGMPITGHPPHRTGRAAFPHPA